jgi:hypothetical protein
MTAYLVFTECEPMLVMAAEAAVEDGRLSDRLAAMGYDCFIAHEVPLDLLRGSYGLSLEVLEADIRRGKPVRILDSNGRHVFETVPFSELGPAHPHGCSAAAAAH